MKRQKIQDGPATETVNTNEADFLIALAERHVGRLKTALAICDSPVHAANLAEALRIMSGKLEELRAKRLAILSRTYEATLAGLPRAPMDARKKPAPQDLQGSRREPLGDEKPRTRCADL